MSQKLSDEQQNKLWDGACEATPDHVLETQLRDSRIPKDEIVHYAARRIAELEAVLEECRSVSTHWHSHAVHLKAESERLREEIERYKRTTNERVAGYKSQWKRDAERYRLAKKNNPKMLINIAYGISSNTHAYGVDQIDAAYDAAMQEEKK